MPLEMKILLDDAGQIQVTGPIDNKLVSFGLLELAKEAIAKHNEQREQRRVQLAMPAAVPFAMKKGD